MRNINNYCSSLLLHLIKTHEFFLLGIVGGFEEKVGKSRIKTKK